MGGAATLWALAGTDTNQVRIAIGLWDSDTNGVYDTLYREDLWRIPTNAFLKVRSIAKDSLQGRLVTTIYDWPNAQSNVFTAYFSEITNSWGPTSQVLTRGDLFFFAASVLPVIQYDVARGVVIDFPKPAVSNATEIVRSSGIQVIQADPKIEVENLNSGDSDCLMGSVEAGVGNFKASWNPIQACSYHSEFGAPENYMVIWQKRGLFDWPVGEQQILELSASKRSCTVLLEPGSYGVTVAAHYDKPNHRGYYAVAEGQVLVAEGVPPPDALPAGAVITFPPQDVVMVKDSFGAFAVQATGSEPLIYLWYFNGSVLANNKKYGGANASMLTIKGLEATDAGAYTVVVSNQWGHAQATAQLTVIDRVVTPPGMAYIPAGAFIMGDTIGDGNTDELPVHSVYVSAYFIDKCEIAKQLWDTVATWGGDHNYDLPLGNSKGLDHPVENIAWETAVKWCNARSEMEGRLPAYYTDATHATVYKSGQLDLTNACVKWDAGYRLPTEAEWEKAARGGRSGLRFPWGNTISHAQANYYALAGYEYNLSAPAAFHPDFYVNPMPYTSPGGYFEANDYGVYDTAGNVWEFCWDRFAPYSPASQIDPHGPDQGPDHVHRGGGWIGLQAVFYCRNSGRSHGAPVGYRVTDLGVRTVLPLGGR